MLRLLHTVSSSWLALASMIRRWKRSLCSTVAWTSSATAAAAIASTSACSALTSSLQPRRGHPRRELLQRAAQLVELEHPALPRIAHIGAAMGLAAHEAEHLELAQRLAHGSLARAVLLRDVHLDEPVARTELPLENPPHEPVPDVMAQRPTACVHEAQGTGPPQSRAGFRETLRNCRRRPTQCAHRHRAPMRRAPPERWLAVPARTRSRPHRRPRPTPGRRARPRSRGRWPGRGRCRRSRACATELAHAEGGRLVVTSAGPGRGRCSRCCSRARPRRGASPPVLLRIRSS